MQERIKSVLNSIHVELGANHQNKSLLSGAAGISLYQFLYYKHFRDGDLPDTYIVSLHELFESATSVTYPAFSGGKSGINWYYSFLFNRGLLEDSDFLLLTSDDEMLAASAITYLRSDYYDLLHGGLGIARQLLYSKSELFSPFVDQVFEELDKIFSKGPNMFRHFDNDSRRLDVQKTNLGLSHGLAGILKFCLECYSKNICADQARKYATIITQFLISNTHKEIKGCFFTSILNHATEEQLPSRLAWCYGDLGMGYILLQAGQLLKNPKLENFALEVLIHSTRTKNDENAKVADAGFCHGTAGNAYIYKKLWHLTNNIIFSNACDYWIGETLDYAKHSDGIAGFKSYNGIKSTFENSPGLLEGTAGIGLVLLSYLTDDFDWDYCVMMNKLTGTDNA